MKKITKTTYNPRNNKIQKKIDATRNTKKENAGKSQENEINKMQEDDIDCDAISLEDNHINFLLNEEDDERSIERLLKHRKQAKSFSKELSERKKNANKIILEYESSLEKEYKKYIHSSDRKRNTAVEIQRLREENIKTEDDVEKEEKRKRRSIYDQIIEKIFYYIPETKKNILDLITVYKKSILENKSNKERNSYINLFYVMTLSDLNYNSLFDLIFLLSMSEVKLIFLSSHLNFLNFYSEIIAAELNIEKKNEFIYEIEKVPILPSELIQKNHKILFEKIVRTIIEKKRILPYFDASSETNPMNNINIVKKYKKIKKYNEGKVEIGSEKKELKVVEEFDFIEKNFGNDLYECTIPHKEYEGRVSFSYDIDCFYIFLSQNSNFDIFRNELNIQVDFKKMKQQSKKFKSPIFLKTDNSFKKICDFLTLQFCSVATNIGIFYFYFVFNSDNDNNTLREEVANLIINVANEYVENLNANLIYLSRSSYYDSFFFNTKRKVKNLDNENNNADAQNIEIENKNDNQRRSILNISSLKSSQVIDIIKKIFSNKDILKKGLKGVYMRAIGTKGSCYTLNSPKVIMKKTAKVFKYENFTNFIVDAAITVCRQEKDFSGKILFLDIKNFTDSKTGISNFLGSQLTQNYNKNLCNFDKKQNKINININGQLKKNLYSTFASSIFSRKLKLSRALQFSAISFFIYISRKIGLEEPEIKYLKLIEEIQKKTMNLKNEDFGYRFESTIEFSSTSTFLQKNSDLILNQKKITFETIDLVKIINTYSEYFLNLIISVKKDLIEIKKTIIAEILIIQLFFQGVCNTHQLESPDLIKNIKNHLILKDRIGKINLVNSIEKFESFVSKDHLNITLAKIIKNCYNLKKNQIELIKTYNNILNTHHPFELTSIFLESYEKAFDSKSDQKDLTNESKKNHDLYHLENWFTLLQTSKIKSFNNKSKFIVIFKVISELKRNIFLEFKRNIEKFIFIDSGTKMVRIYDDSGKKKFLKITNIEIIDQNKKIDENASEELTREKIEEVLTDLHSNNQSLRDIHTIEEKARIIAANNFYQDKLNRVKEIHEDVRFLLFGIKTKTQINHFINNFKKNEKKIQNNLMSIESSKNHNKIKKMASSYNFLEISLGTIFKIYTEFYNIKDNNQFYKIITFLYNKKNSKNQTYIDENWMQKFDSISIFRNQNLNCENKEIYLENKINQSNNENISNIDETLEDVSNDNNSFCEITNVVEEKTIAIMKQDCEIIREEQIRTENDSNSKEESQTIRIKENSPKKLKSYTNIDKFLNEKWIKNFIKKLKAFLNQENKRFDVYQFFQKKYDGKTRPKKNEIKELTLYLIENDYLNNVDGVKIYEARERVFE